MTGFDISLTALLISIYMCTSDETGPSYICRSNQSVHKRLKIIHLNFQNMEHTFVHYNSGQLFQSSIVVHVISVQPHEVHCFNARADKKKINIRSERKTKLPVTDKNI